jgi:hypothetical protein
VRARSLGAALIVGTIAALALAWGVGRSVSPAPAAAPASLPRPQEGAPPSRAPVDPRGLRDVFRFADEARRTQAPGGTLARPSDQPTPVPGPRLVGLVRRGDRLLAALAVDGTVLLLGPGESASGLTVVSVAEDGVRLRRSDGEEQTLTPP